MQYCLAKLFDDLPFLPQESDILSVAPVAGLDPEVPSGVELPHSVAEQVVEINQREFSTRQNLRDELLEYIIHADK